VKEEEASNYMKNRKRKYYIPGILTLLFLPIMCYIYLSNYGKDERVRVVIICEKYDSTMHGNSYKWDTTFLSKPGNKRIYSDIVLDADENVNNQNLQIFENKLCELKSNNDTINGIHIIFEKGMKYKFFINAIDVCYKCDSFPAFAIYDNNLWAIYFKKSKEKLERNRARAKEQAEENLLKINKRKYRSSNIHMSTSIVLKFCVLILMFLFLGYVSIKKMIE
jgi:hypothetical protein